MQGSAEARQALREASTGAAADTAAEAPLHFGEFDGEAFTADDLRRNASEMRQEADRCGDDADWAEDLRGRAEQLDADAGRLDSADETAGNVLPPPVDTMVVSLPDGEEAEIPYDVWRRFSELNDALGDGSADERAVFADRDMWRPEDFAARVGGRLAALTDHGTDEFSDLHDWAYAACDVMDAIQASELDSEKARDRRSAILRLPWDQPPGAGAQPRRDFAASLAAERPVETAEVRNGRRLVGRVHRCADGYWAETPTLMRIRGMHGTAEEAEAALREVVDE